MRMMRRRIPRVAIRGIPRVGIRDPWLDVFDDDDAYELGGPAPLGCFARDRFEILDFFKFNNVFLRPFHITEIRAIAARIKASLATASPTKNVLIVGHTDDRGSLSTNVDIGRKRAKAAAFRLQVELGADRTKVKITTDSKGETAPVAPNSIARGRACNRRVEVFLETAGQTCKGLSFRHFFTQYDLRTQPTSMTIGVPANPNMTAAEQTQRISDVMSVIVPLRARLAARAAVARSKSAPGAIPPVDIDAVKRLSNAQIDLFFEAFPAPSSNLDVAGFRRAFQEHANGQMRAPELGEGVGEPDSAAFFLYGEFALLCIENGVRAAIWEELLRWFLSAEEVFMHVYRPKPHPAPPAVNAALPAVCDPPKISLSAYKSTRFDGAGTSSDARKSDLVAKYVSMSLADLKKAGLENLLRAQCMK